MPSYQRILVCIDGSRAAQAALTESIRLAGNNASHVLLLRVIDCMPSLLGPESTAVSMGDVLPRMQEVAQSIMRDAARMSRTAEIPTECRIVMPPHGQLSEVVAEQARLWGADLIVLGTQERSGFERLLMGSHSEAIAREAPVPVLMIHPGRLPKPFPGAALRSVACIALESLAA